MKINNYEITWKTEQDYMEEQLKHDLYDEYDNEQESDIDFLIPDELKEKIRKINAGEQDE